MSRVKMLQYVSEYLGKEGFSMPLSSLSQLELSEIDSLQLATLMLDLESKYNISFSHEFLDLITQKTVSDLVSTISGEE